MPHLTVMLSPLGCLYTCACVHCELGRPAATITYSKSEHARVLVDFDSWKTLLLAVAKPGCVCP